jgi:dTDP-glucose 4,6-dehydratase
MKKVLITGGAGFIASHVATYLSRRYPQYKIVIVDKLTYCSNMKNMNQVKDLKFYHADVTSVEEMESIFNEERFDIVMHFAAYTHVDMSFGNSLLFTSNNVLGTHVLLEVSKRYGVKKFLHVSTDEVYGEGKNDTLSTEGETILTPTNPYAATKAAAEHLVRSYHISFGLPIVITRGNNVYGPGQYPEKVIPKFI